MAGMKPFAIFRSGSHTTSKGQTLAFAETDLADIVASYDPALHEAPIVIGHPKQDGPAWGWIKSLSARDGTVYADPRQVDATFSEMVQQGRFKKVSAGLYHPDQKGNPTPGKYHLRHVGFLGAEPPAIKGLAAVEFSEEAETEVEIEFSEWRQSWAFDVAARLFRSLRERLIETDGADVADRVIPGFEVDQLSQTGTEIRAEDHSDPVAAQPVFSETQPEEPDMKTAEQRQAELDAREAAVADREKAIDTRETTFSESQRAARLEEDTAFVASVVTAGRLPVGLKEAATALFSELDDSETLTFSEAGADVTRSPRAVLRGLLEKLPVPVVTGELATGDGPDFSDPAHVRVAIETEIKAARDRGETLDPATALSRLKAQK